MADWELKLTTSVQHGESIIPIIATLGKVKNLKFEQFLLNVQHIISKTFVSQRLLMFIFVFD